MKNGLKLVSLEKCLILKGHKSTYEICKQTACSGIQNQNKCHMSKQKIKTNMADFDCFYCFTSMFRTRDFNCLQCLHSTTFMSL